MILCCITIVVLAYINYRVIKIVKTKDKVLVAMLTCLKLSLFWDAVFFGFQMSEIQGYVCMDNYYYCMTTISVFWPGLLLGIALMLTFNKWVNFTVMLYTVKKQLLIDTNETDALGRLKNISRMAKLGRYLNNAFTIFVSLALSGLGFAYSFKGCND